MLKNKLLNEHGKPLNIAPSVKKQGFAQFSSIYEYPNQQRYRSRFYVNQDSELGASNLTRDFICRWSRELCAQTGWVYSAIRMLALYSVGSAYLPQYQGNNKEWGKLATTWLTNEFYPNCNKRGPTFDFTTTMFVASMMLDQDGDMLCIYGEDESGNPKIQIVPSHRISSRNSKNQQDTFFVTPSSENTPTAGPLPNTIVSDGVVYDYQGGPVGYNVMNPNNMVNSLLGNQGNQFFSTKDAQLIYDPRFFDRGRGFPSISSAVLTGLSLQEIQDYMVEKLKIESMVALVEKTPNGEGPLEDNNSYASMLAESNDIGLYPGIANGAQSATKGLKIVTGPTIKYVNASGGDIKSLASNTPAGETQEYITRLESHVLQAIGVPHPLLFSPEKISGRMSDGVGKLFNSSINYRQKILDKWAAFICSWAVAKAIKNGDLPPNDEESLYGLFTFTHPAAFTLNDGYDRQSDVSDYQAGLKSLTEILSKRNKNIVDFMKEIEDEKTLFFQTAQNIAKATDTDIKLVINSLREDLAMDKIPYDEGTGLTDKENL